MSVKNRDKEDDILKNLQEEYKRCPKCGQMYNDETMSLYFISPTCFPCLLRDVLNIYGESHAKTTLKHVKNKYDRQKLIRRD